MAKIPFGKLGLKTATGTKELVINDLIVEVKQYLPVEQKVSTIEGIVNTCLNERGYYNPLQLEVNFTLEMIFAYTNLSFTEKQKEDKQKLYDLISAGFAAQVLELIPETEKGLIYDTALKVIKEFYSYKNSALGIMESIATDYSTLDFNATELQQKIGDPNNLTLLKNVLQKLG